MLLLAVGAVEVWVLEHSPHRHNTFHIPAPPQTGNKARDKDVSAAHGHALGALHDSPASPARRRGGARSRAAAPCAGMTQDPNPLLL